MINKSRRSYGQLGDYISPTYHLLREPETAIDVFSTTKKFTEPAQLDFPNGCSAHFF